MSAPTVLISASELDSLLKSEPVVLIDTRDADTYAAGHIPGAVNLREIFTFLAASTAEGLAELKGTFARHFGAIGLSGLETAVFYEDALNSGYGQSCRGYYLLTWLGYPKVKVLNGGFSAWKGHGMPISTDTVSPPKAATFPTDLKMADVMLTNDEMLAAVLGKRGTNTVLLDVRDIDEWIGDSSSPYGKDSAPRKGRIPGAKGLEWYRFMKPSAQGPMIKSPDEVKAEAATAGISTDDTVFAPSPCGGGPGWGQMPQTRSACLHRFHPHPILPPAGEGATREIAHHVRCHRTHLRQHRQDPPAPRRPRRLDGLRREGPQQPGVPRHEQGPHRGRWPVPHAQLRGQARAGGGR